MDPEINKNTTKCFPGSSIADEQKVKLESNTVIGTIKMNTTIETNPRLDDPDEKFRSTALQVYLISLTVMFVTVMAIVLWKIVKRDWSCCQEDTENPKSLTGIIPSGSIKVASTTHEGGEYEPLNGTDRHKYSSSSNETQRTTIEDYNQVEDTINVNVP